MTPTQPRTKAGKVLWAEWNTETLEGMRWKHYLDAIAAIEEEAAQPYIEALRQFDPAVRRCHVAVARAEEAMAAFNDLEAAIKEVRSLLQADQPSGEESGR